MSLFGEIVARGEGRAVRKEDLIHLEIQGNEFTGYHFILGDKDYWVKLQGYTSIEPVSECCDPIFKPKTHNFTFNIGGYPDCWGYVVQTVDVLDAPTSEDIQEQATRAFKIFLEKMSVVHSTEIDINHIVWPATATCER